LFDVYNFGTASALRVEGIDICGKTAENFTLKSTELGPN
jgi:penicillin-binding protein 2